MDDDEDLSLDSLEGKGKVKAKKDTSGEATSQARKKKDLRKVKLFACHKSRHYASQC